MAVTEGPGDVGGGDLLEERVKELTDQLEQAQSSSNKVCVCLMRLQCCILLSPHLQSAPSVAAELES